MPFDPKIRFDQGGAAEHFRFDRDFTFVPIDRLDAAENAFLERSLRHMIPTMFRREYAKINARTIFPVYFANDPGAETISYEETEEVAEAEIVRNYADDAPLAEVKTDEFDSKVRSVRAAAQWDIQEIRAAAKANRPLSQRKTNAARDAMFRTENRVAFQGDADFNLVGLFSDANVPRDTAAATFAAGSAAANLQELHDLANAIPANTEDIESGGVLCLPPTQFDLVATQRLGTTGEGPMVLQDFLATNPHVSQVFRVRELAGAGTGGVDTALIFDRNIEKVRMNVALDLEQFAPERRGMVVRVEYHMRIGGLTIPRPLSMRILEGI